MERDLPGKGTGGEKAFRTEALACAKALRWEKS